MRAFDEDVYTPQYMKERKVLHCCFEDHEDSEGDRLPFYIEDIVRGATRGMGKDGKVENNATVTGKIQFMVKIKDSFQKSVGKHIDPEFKPYLETK